MAMLVQQSNNTPITLPPTIRFIGRQSVRLFFYVSEGHIIVDFGRWLVLYCGRVSETAMLLATLWVTATFVTPELTDKLGATALLLSSLSMIAFSLLPEVILFSAIIKTLKHWQVVIHERKSVAAWAWAGLYTLPTATFFGMTVYTISTFVSASGHMQIASGGALVLRCLAGWFYSLVGLIHANTKMQKQEHSLATQVTHTSEVEQLREELTAQRRTYEQSIQRLLQSVQPQKAPVVEQQNVLLSNSEIIPIEQMSYRENDYRIVSDWNGETGLCEWSSLPVVEQRMSERIVPPDMPMEQEKDTDTLPVVEPQKEPLPVEKSNSLANRIKRGSKPLQHRSTRKTKRTRGDATEQVREVLEANSKASLTDIVNETGLSRSRVSEIRTAILQEWQEKTNSLSNGHTPHLHVGELVPLEV